MDETGWSDFEDQVPFPSPLQAGFGVPLGTPTSSTDLTHVAADNSFAPATNGFDSDIGSFSNAPIFPENSFDNSFAYHGYESTVPQPYPRGYTTAPVANQPRNSRNNLQSHPPVPVTQAAQPNYPSYASYPNQPPAHRHAHPPKPVAAVTPETIESEVSRTLAHINNCLAMLGRLHQQQQQMVHTGAVVFSPSLLQAPELQNARRAVLGWMNRFNREISTGYQMPLPQQQQPLLPGGGAQMPHLQPPMRGVPNGAMYLDQLQQPQQQHGSMPILRSGPDRHAAGGHSAASTPRSDSEGSTSSSATSTPAQPGMPPQQMMMRMTQRRSSHFFDQDPAGASSAPSDEDPDEAVSSPRNSHLGGVGAATAIAQQHGFVPTKQNMLAAKSHYADAQIPTTMYHGDWTQQQQPGPQMAPMFSQISVTELETTLIEEKPSSAKKNSKKRAAADDIAANAAKRRAAAVAAPPVVEMLGNGAGAVMQFKVNPSKSVPHKFNNSSGAPKQGKIPSSLAKTGASEMMYSFNFKKESKKAAAAAALAAAAGTAAVSDVEAGTTSGDNTHPTRKTSSIGTELPGGPVSLADFDQLGVLGTGTFGKVKLCMHRTTRQYFCLKVLRKQIIYRYHQLNHVQNEKLVLAQVHHPGVVRLFSTFNDAENLYLLLEYAPGGELFTLIRKFGKFSEDVARFYAAEIIIILEYLHAKNIVYRDLKPENILLEPHGHVKLADFGFAKQISDRTWTMCGTPDYMAPELIAMSGHGCAVDYWSLGVLVFEMLVGYPPFTDSTTMGLFAKIREPSKLVIPQHVSNEAAHFIRSLLVVDPSRRLGNIHKETLNIRGHPWFAGLDWNSIEARNQIGPILPMLRSAGDTANFEVSEQATDRLVAQPDVELPPDVQKFFDGF